MAKPIISIIGLGLTGTSLGLALQREETNFEIVGHDKEPEMSRRARQLGAVQRTEWNLHSAVDGCNLVVLAIPLSEVADTLGHIAADLQPGTLVLISVNAMQPAIEFADEHLSEEIRCVVLHPILNGVGGTPSARADLFDGTTICLAPTLQTAPEAVQLASDFVERIGAKPLFMDPQEHDGIIAGVEYLPQLLAAALMRVSTGAPGWVEAQRLAGRQFAQSTELLSSAEQMLGTFQANREVLMMRLGQLQQELASWQLWLSQEAAGDDPDALKRALEASKNARDEWELKAEFKDWSTNDAPAIDQTPPGMMRQLFFGNLLGGKRASRGDDNR